MIADDPGGIAADFAWGLEGEEEGRAIALLAVVVRGGGPKPVWLWVREQAEQVGLAGRQVTRKAVGEKGTRGRGGVCCPFAGFLRMMRWGAGARAYSTRLVSGQAGVRAGWCGGASGGRMARRQRLLRQRRRLGGNARVRRGAGSRRGHGFA